MPNDLKERTLGTRLAIRKLKLAGIDPVPLIEQAGLSPNAINDEYRWIPTGQKSRLYQLAAQALNDPHFGLHLAEEFDVLDLGAIGYIGLSSSTLHDAILNLQRYMPTVSKTLSLELDLDDDEARIITHFKAVDLPGQQIVVESTLCAMLIAYQRYLQAPLVPKEVHFTHKSNADHAEYTRVLNCPVKFGQNRSGVILHRCDLERPIETADDRLIKALTKDLLQVAESRSINASKLVARIEEAALPFISKGQASAKLIADKIGISERSLHRHLSEQGKSFKSVLEELKKQLALNYLKQAEINLAQTAFLLGYSDQSSFTTAFKRWTGLTPRQAQQLNRAK